MTKAVHVLGLLQISVAVVLAQNGWEVKYTTQSICAYTGSTVEISCTYTYPSGLTVTSTFWLSPDGVTDLTQDQAYSGRVTYTGGNTLRITDLRTSDSAVYRFRFITDQAGGKYTGQPGFILSVTDGPKNTRATLSPSGEIVEGSLVTLTCSSDANPPVDKYTWYKKKVTSPKASGQSYSIANIRSEDSGEYYCEAENKCGRFNSSSVFVDVHCEYNLLSALN
ncbi:hypothetical protein UPYG_G00062390 [Umbra pygmaea]|uniref:Ig-like domain-containing protein n=1 Tax=Umbra pygmaea TaxID=75934 RepID=A0ABD0XCP7_UMBPY